MPKTLNFLTADRVKELLLSDRPPSWPKEIRVVDADVEEQPDWSGDDALFVVLLVPDETAENVLESLAVDAARRVVRDRLDREGEPRFAYVRVRRLGERAGSNDPAEQEGDE